MNGSVQLRSAHISRRWLGEKVRYQCTGWGPSGNSEAAHIGFRNVEMVLVYSLVDLALGRGLNFGSCFSSRAFGHIFTMIQMSAESRAQGGLGRKFRHVTFNYPCIHRWIDFLLYYQLKQFCNR